jgi:signal transduction histidine kinase
MSVAFIAVRNLSFLAGVCSLACSLAAGEAPASRPARRAIEYALTSSYSWEIADPKDWRLLASNDDGASWVLLDTQTNQVFQKRSERRAFPLHNEIPFNIYRLEIDVDSGVQLAELELKGPVAGVANESDLQVNVTASNEHPLVGPALQAFDNDPATKWVGFRSGASRICWIQCQYTLHAELQLTNVSACIVASRRMADRSPLLDQAPQILAELGASATKPCRALAGYAITSANDFPSRDPRDWRLLGSNDGGQTWHTLDVRRNESFATRFERRVFNLSSQAAYSIYRLQIDSVRTPDGAPDGASSLQLAEIEPLYPSNLGQDQFGMAIEAQGDNPPIEAAEAAFDGDSKTKWLDFTDDGNTNKSTWIQWQYFAAPGSPVINLRKLRAARNHAPLPVRLLLRGVVVAWRPESATLGFLDESGFQLFKLDPPVSGLKAGLHIRLAGVMKFGAGLPVVAEPQVVNLGDLPSISEFSPGQALAKNPGFAFGFVQAKAEFISEDTRSITIGFTQEKGEGRLLAKVVGPNPARLPFAPGNWLRAEGVVEPVFDDRGCRVAGVLWVSGSDHISLLPPKDTNPQKSTKSLKPPVAAEEPTPASSVARAYELIEQQPAKSIPASVRGVITYIDLGLGYFYIQDGPDAILVGNQLGAGLAPFMQNEGAYVDLQAEVSPNQPGLQATSFVTVLGKGQMPQPLRHSIDYLTTGRDDGQWVQVEGVVSACEEHRLTLSVLGGRIMAWINEFDKEARDRLLGCQVRVNGVCSPVRNSRNQRLGVRLLVPAREFIEIVTRPPEDPFSLPSRSIARLLQSESRRAPFPTTLIKTVGVVTHSEPRMLFVQDGSEGLRVWLRANSSVEPGDRVEAVGFVEPDGFSPKLVQALARKVGRASLPQANPIDLLLSDLSSEDATRGQIDAMYLGRSTKESMQVLELQDGKRQRTFSAFFPVAHGLLPPIPVGSRVRLQGVLKADTDTLPDFGKVLASFQMFANSPHDLTILARPSWWNLRRTLWGLSGAIGAVLACLAWVGLLHRQVARRTLELRAEVDQRRRTAGRLEAEIAERKRMEAQVEKTHHELLDASRQAGMAEVATSVLHNVGNVLNSVNVSANLLSAQLKNSKITNLARAAKLLREHETDLADFISRDEKGRQLPNYLERLTEHLLGEQSSASAELASLVRNVEHIKEIVAMQQSNARVGGVTEVVHPARLVEDVLRLHVNGLAHHSVELVRDFASDVPPITVDKHKVIQVLVNLIHNAKYACDQSSRPDKRLTVRVANGDGHVRFSIIDNGVGIPPENLTRIFSHGFTTRKDGHGFGLHSSALAAKEMGGALLAHSDGVGMGATFTLELPLLPADLAA